jgi:hypothetical protein
MLFRRPSRLSWYGAQHAAEHGELLARATLQSQVRDDCVEAYQHASRIYAAFYSAPAYAGHVKGEDAGSRERRYGPKDNSPPRVQLCA